MTGLALVSFSAWQALRMIQRIHSSAPSTLTAITACRHASSNTSSDSTAGSFKPETGAHSLDPLQMDQDPSAVEERKRAAVRGFMSARLGGAARAELAQLLQSHGVIVKGGQGQAMALLDALEAWKDGRMPPNTTADSMRPTK